MPKAKIGGSDVAGCYLGSIKLDKAYLNNIIVCPSYDFLATISTVGGNGNISYNFNCDVFVDFGDGNIVSYTGPGTHVVNGSQIDPNIPISIKGINVTSFSTNVATDTSEIVDITKADKLVSINDGYIQHASIKSFTMYSESNSIISLDNTFGLATSLTDVSITSINSRLGLGSTFLSCSALTTVTLNAVIDYQSQCFSGASSLVNIYGMDCSNIDSGLWMFRGCSSLDFNQLSTYIDFSSLNYGYGMFESSSIDSVLQISTINFSQLTNAQSMFNSSSLTFFGQSEANGGTLLNMNMCTDVSYMLRGCYGLTQVPKISMASVTNMSYFIENSVNVAGKLHIVANNNNTIQANNMASYSQRLQEIVIEGFEGVSTLSYAFTRCFDAVNISIGTASNCTDFSSAFFEAKSLPSVRLINTQSATTVNSMFSLCYNLVDVSTCVFDLSNTASISSMFNECRLLTDVVLVNSANVSSIAATFKGTYKLQTITGLSDMLNITNCNAAFYNTRLTDTTGLRVPAMNTQNCSDFNNMFANAKIDCMAAIDTTFTGATKTGMFAGATIYYNAPTSAEVTQLESASGLNYVNPSACPPVP